MSTTTTPPSRRGSATRAELEDLHRELSRHLLRELRKDNPTAADLDVARKFLADNSVSPSDPKTARQLKRLHSLYSERMTTLLERGDVSATALQETRLFLQTQKAHASSQALTGGPAGDPLLALPFPKGPTQ